MLVMTVRYRETLHRTLQFLHQTLSNVQCLFQALVKVLVNIVFLIKIQWGLVQFHYQNLSLYLLMPTYLVFVMGKLDLLPLWLLEWLVSVSDVIFFDRDFAILSGYVACKFSIELKFIPGWIQLYLWSKLSLWLHAQMNWNFSPTVISTLS